MENRPLLLAAASLRPRYIAHVGAGEWEMEK
jgi:hypothetical protein